VRWTPVHESHMVKGKGQDNMMKLIEESYAPNRKLTYLRLIGLSVFPCVYTK
jgi:hypothetical protein